MTTRSERPLSVRLNDWWTFLATRMNHPDTSVEDLREGREALLADLRAASTMLATMEMVLENSRRDRAKKAVRINELKAENERLENVLRAISRNPCGVPGHAVAVGCGSDVLARKALEK